MNAGYLGRTKAELPRVRPRDRRSRPVRRRHRPNHRQHNQPQACCCFLLLLLLVVLVLLLPRPRNGALSLISRKKTVSKSSLRVIAYVLQNFCTIIVNVSIILVSTFYWKMKLNGVSGNFSFSSFHFLFYSDNAMILLISDGWKLVVYLSFVSWGVYVLFVVVVNSEVLVDMTNRRATKATGDLVCMFYRQSGKTGSIHQCMLYVPGPYTCDLDRVRCHVHICGHPVSFHTVCQTHRYNKRCAWSVCTYRIQVYA